MIITMKIIKISHKRLKEIVNASELQNKCTPATFRTYKLDKNIFIQIELEK